MKYALLASGAVWRGTGNPPAGSTPLNAMGYEIALEQATAKNRELRDKVYAEEAAAIKQKRRDVLNAR